MKKGKPRAPKARAIEDIVKELKNRGSKTISQEPEPTPGVPMVAPPPEPKKIVAKCWDGDIYILTGFDSPQEVREKIMGLDWVRMPNGSEIHASTIKKFITWEDYCFQTDQQARHKRGEYLAGRQAESWHSHKEGYIGESNIKAIAPGLNQEAPKLKQSTTEELASGQDSL